MRTVPALVTSLLVVSGTMAHAASPDAKSAEPTISNAREAMVLFAKVCVNTLGREKGMTDALMKLNAAGIANQLKPEEAAKVVPASQKDDAWILIGPETKQRLMVTYDTVGICGMYVHAADENGIVKEYDGLVNAFAAETKGKIIAKAPMKTEDGTIFYKEIKTSVGPIYSIALSTAPKASPTGTQHMMTFAHSSGN